MVNTYNTYKNSGIEWIPYIPQSWKTMRLKNVGFLYGGLTGKTGDDFNVEDDNESYMLFIPFTNIFNNSIINPNQLYKVKVSNDENQNLVQKNDLLFLMSSEDYDGIGKPAILEDSIDNLGLNSFSKGLRITNQDIYPKFLFYYLSSHVSRELVRREAKGFIRINLRQDRLHCCKIILPAIHEQQAIASFLIQEPEFFIDKRLDTDTADCLCLVQHILIEHSLLLVLGLGINVDAEEFPAAHLHRVRIADGRVIIQIKRYAVVTQWFLSQCYVGACKCHSYIVF